MIIKPTLLIDEKKCRKNIEAMFSKAQKSNIVLRPHFKTHQSLEIGQWFKEAGVDRITVSSLDMAQYFSSEWNDITVAFPVNILEIEAINDLAKKIKLNVLIESCEAASFLKENLEHETEFFIKIDAGNLRTGIPYSDTQKIDEILAITDTSDKLYFKGFLAHDGHTYKCRTKAEVLAVHQKSMGILNALKKRYSLKYPHLIVSPGDTPSCSIAENFDGMDEIRPGNFVFYDLVQQQIGSCTFDQIAVALACPIVAIHKDRNEIVIYGGGVHLSKDRMTDEKDGIVEELPKGRDNGWGGIIPEMFVKKISQEHGIVSVSPSEISNYKIGDILIVLPVHSCMTVDLMKNYLTTDSKWIKR